MTTIFLEDATVGRRIEYTAGDFVGDNGLIFIEEAEPYVKPSGRKSRKARFLCICGSAFDTLIESVKSGHASSCGCYQVERVKECCSREMSTNWRGGVLGHYLYDTWKGMIARCNRVSHKFYSKYGGRGIKVCPEWHDSVTFLEFCDTVLGERPEGHTLDRIDNDGDYEPGNVRWADAKTQNNNRRK